MRVIINADDFGRSPQINAAVVRAHREGVLTSASLMVAGAAASEAVELARQNPSLAVGLHLVVSDGPAVLPPDQLGQLVNARGQFPNSPAMLGLKYALLPNARRNIRAEIKAQFERFASFGLTLDHVDGHQHMHMHPAIFDCLVPLARQFGAGRVRIVRDDLMLALHHNSRGAVGKFVLNAIFAILARRCRRTGLDTVSRTYGFLQSGAMDEQYVLAVLQQLNVPAEIYFHPTVGPRLDALGPNPQDLATLLSPTIRQQMEARQLLYDDRRVVNGFVPCPSSGELNQSPGPSASSVAAK